MALATVKSADTFYDVATGVAINCDWPLYEQDEVQVIYGKVNLLAELNVDYTVTLNPSNYNTFQVTPLAALLTKINNLIAADGTEINYITVRRVLENTTTVQTETVRLTPFLSREIDRIHMKLQQQEEAIARAILFPLKRVGTPDAAYYVDDPQDGYGVIWDGSDGRMRNTVASLANLEGDAQTVADNIEDINDVADDLNGANTIGTVSNNLTGANTIGIVAAIDTGITTLAGISGQMVALEAIDADITTLAGLTTEMSGLYAINPAISGVYSIRNNVNIVASDLAGDDNISIVAGAISDINVLAGIAGQISNVAEYLNVSKLIDVTNAIDLGKSQAAIGDGALHLANEFYASFAALQADYPNCTSAAYMDYSIDQIVIEYIKYANLIGYFPKGTYMCNFASSQSNKTYAFVGEEGTVFKGSGTAQDAKMFTDTNCVSIRSKIKYDLDYKFSTACYFTTSSLDYSMTETDCEYINGGLDATPVSNFTAFVWLGGSNIRYRIYNQKCTNLKATGNDATAGGSAAGSARYVLVAPSSGATVDGEIINRFWPAGESDARELDLFNQNTGVVYGGTIMRGGYQDHTELVRRPIKVHSGGLDIFNSVFAQASSFTPAAPVGGDPQSEVSVKGIECLGFAGSGTSPGYIRAYGCFIDTRAFPLGVANAGQSVNGSVHCLAGCRIIGPSIAHSRINPETGANQQGVSISFRGATYDQGSGVENCTFIGGMQPVQINGNRQYARGNIFDDPAGTYAIYLNDIAHTGTAQSGSTSSTIVLAAGANSANEYYNSKRVRITSGTGAGQVRVISDYVGSTKTATVYPDWSTTPDNTSVYAVASGGIEIKDNKIINKSVGRMGGGEVIRCQGNAATEAFVQGNKFIRAGGDAALTVFINPATDMAGVFSDNQCNDPNMTCVDNSNTNTQATFYNNNGNQHVKAGTSTTYTLNRSDCFNRRTLSNAGAITCTLPKDLPVGSWVEVEQLGAGQVTFVGASGATLQNRSSHTKTAGQYGVVRLYVRTNTTGTNAVWVLSGDTAA